MKVAHVLEPYFLPLVATVANDFEMEVHLTSLEFSQFASCEDDWGIIEESSLRFRFGPGILLHLSFDTFGTCNDTTMTCGKYHRSKKLECVFVLR
jgi:hypothetical protein